MVYAPNKFHALLEAECINTTTLTHCFSTPKPSLPLFSYFPSPLSFSFSFTTSFVLLTLFLFQVNILYFILYPVTNGWLIYCWNQSYINYHYSLSCIHFLSFSALESSFIMSVIMMNYWLLLKRLILLKDLAFRNHKCTWFLNSLDSPIQLFIVE